MNKETTTIRIKKKTLKRIKLEAVKIGVSLLEYLEEKLKYDKK